MSDAPPSPKTPLYRPEVTAHRARSLYGDIILRGSMSSWVITALLCIIIVGAMIFGFMVKVEGQPIFSWMLEQVR